MKVVVVGMPGGTRGGEVSCQEAINSGAGSVKWV